VLNFLAIPAYGLLYDLPSFYRSDTIQSDLLDGSKARDRLKEISVFVRRLGQASWLYYDDANFNGPRLTGSRWGTLRTFFRRLYGPTLTCIGCGRAVGAYALDHIAPVSRGYFQTLINFRPLCRSCNSAKGNLLGEDPYRPRIFIPRELPTDGLDIIYTSVPPWLGSIQRPGSERDLLRPDIGHD
jgi:5-methylcytosine-specific restriction endonuclease McrA